MTPRIRLLRLAVWAAVANLAMMGVAATLASSPRTAEAARRLLVLCGLG